jgi:Zn finger protein HypA/HybF involved in hydrogenase expression
VALQGHPLGENARIIGRVTGGASKYGGDANSVWHHVDRRYARGRPVAAHLLGGHALHEIGIASSIPETADAEARKRPGERNGPASRELSSISPDALMFAFETLTLGEPKDGIEWCPRRQKCQVCGEEFTVADFEMACPKCGECRSTCISGTEWILRTWSWRSHARGRRKKGAE